MMTIHKYPLDQEYRQEVEMTQGAKILSCQFQGSQLCLWALLEPDNKPETKIIEIACTGEPIEFVLHGNFIATVQHPTLPIVWHIFER